MKTTVKKETVEKAFNLLKVIEARKQLEKQEKELKDFFKEELSGLNSMLAGEILITIADRTRTDIDRKLLVSELGDEAKRFEKTMTYQVMDVKLA